MPGLLRVVYQVVLNPRELVVTDEVLQIPIAASAAIETRAQVYVAICCLPTRQYSSWRIHHSTGTQQTGTRLPGQSFLRYALLAQFGYGGLCWFRMIDLVVPLPFGQPHGESLPVLTFLSRQAEVLLTFDSRSAPYLPIKSFHT